MGIIKKPSELAPKTAISALIYGDPGAGKTTLACSAPSPVLFDYDGGATRINGAHQVPTVQIQSWEDTNAALLEIDREMPECRSIIIDTVGKMLDYMGEYIIRTDCTKAQRDGSLSLKGYGVRKQMFLDFLHRVLVSGRNVIFVAHVREDKRGEDAVVKRPDIGGSSAYDLIKELDLVGYLGFQGKDRVIFFSPEEGFNGKNTCNIEPALKVPVTVDAAGNAVGSNNFISQIISRYGEVQARNRAERAKFEALMSRALQAIDECGGVDDINKFCEGVPAIEHIYNSKALMSQAVSRKAKALGLTFNKTSARYE